MMKKPILKYWHYICKLMADEKTCQEITLHLYKEDDHAIACHLKPNGNIKISTTSGGGGYRRKHDEGRSAEDWVNLINEANSVANHYWGI